MFAAIDPEVLTNLIMIPVALVMGIIFFIVAKRRIRFLLQHRDYFCKPILLTDLPSKYRHHFEDAGIQFQKLGLSEIGDFQIAETPNKIYVRYYRSYDGTILAAAVAILPGSSQASFTFCFNTILENGDVIETSAVDTQPIFELMNKRGRYYCTTMGTGSSIEVNFSAHVRTIGERIQATRSRPLSFAPEQLPELLVYEKRMFSTESNKAGDDCGEVPQPVLPQGHPVFEVAR